MCGVERGKLVNESMRSWGDGACLCTLQLGLGGVWVEPEGGGVIGSL